MAKTELVCLLGPNGAGKSTTFNTICGLLKPDRGSVWIMGQDLAATQPERVGAPGVGFVPEGRRLFPTLTVRENLKLGFDASRCTASFEDRLEEMPGLFLRIRERGTTVLLIEQNVETALSMADRGYLLIRGCIAASGTHADLLKDDTVRHLYL